MRRHGLPMAASTRPWVSLQSPMPPRPATPCTYPMCGSLVRDGTGRCLRHRHAERRAADAQRGTSHDRGYGATWRKLRAIHLRAEPLCRHCQVRGLTVPATDVDHITSKAKGGADTSDNLQSLCHSCHSTKTVIEDGGFKGRG